MRPEHLEQLLHRLLRACNTDEVLELEYAFGPFDEEDTVAVRALFQLAATRCLLARGPAPSPESFAPALTRPAPAYAHESFVMRGRLGTRIVRVGWADGRHFGSLYAIRRLESGSDVVTDADTARQRMRRLFDVTLEESDSPLPRVLVQVPA